MASKLIVTIKKIPKNKINQNPLGLIVTEIPYSNVTIRPRDIFIKCFLTIKYLTFKKVGKHYVFEEISTN